MPDYPVVFTFKDEVYGNGFLAGVLLQGRALIAKEDGDWWAFGVQPAGIAASGSTPLEAYHEFRQVYKEVLFDSAALTSNFEDFQKDVCFLGAQASVPDVARWEAARVAIRQNEVTPEAPFDKLRRETADITFGVQILLRLDDKEKAAFSSTDNQVDNLALAAAA